MALNKQQRRTGDSPNQHRNQTTAAGKGNSASKRYAKVQPSTEPRNLRPARIPVSPILKAGDLELAPGEELVIETHTFEELGMLSPKGLEGFTRYKIFDSNGQLVRHYIRYSRRQPEQAPPAQVEPEVEEAEAAEKVLPEPDAPAAEPAAATESTKHNEGNPGRYLGVRRIFFEYDNVVHTGFFHVIEALEGTWLSAATKSVGWDARYGEAEGYGAYVEGIVRRENGEFCWDLAADDIIPGELFAIEIYESNKKDKEPKDDGPEGEKGPDLEGVSPDETDVATYVGLSIDVLTTIFSQLAPIAAPIQIILGAAAAGRAGNATAALAALRAACYATTAFNWRQHERARVPISSVFTHKGMLPGKLKGATEAWNDSWDETKAELEEAFTEARLEIYKRVVAAGGRPPTIAHLRNHMKAEAKTKYDTAPGHCDALLESVGGYWKNQVMAGEKKLWAEMRKTPYDK